jgi:hypothetical protein
MQRAVLMAILGASVAVSADIGPPTNIPAQARGSSRIVVGQVLDVQSRFETNRFGDQLIVSNVLVDVFEILKGPEQARIYVAVEGGTVGDLTLKVSDLPELKAGERAMFFLDDDAGALLPRGRGRGILKLSQDDRVEGSAATLSDVRQQVRDALGQGGRE